MAFIWDTSWEIGVQDIDSQHRQLVDIINKLGEAMKARKTNDMLASVLLEIDVYAREHFRFEEALMKRYGYTDLDVHVPLHIKFIQQIREFRQQVNAGNISVGVEVFNFLGDWLKGHICGTDMKYAEVIKAKGAI